MLLKPSSVSTRKQEVTLLIFLHLSLMYQKYLLASAWLWQEPGGYVPPMACWDAEEHLLYKADQVFFVFFPLNTLPPKMNDLLYS